MQQNDIYYPQMVKFVLAREGGYVNDPTDKGGETNKGITHATYDSYRRSKGLPKQSVKYMTDEEMHEIYYNNYYKASGADKIENPRLAMYVFDTAVNMGVSVAKDLYKKSNDDLNKFEQLRRNKYEAYVKNDPTQKKYIQGWNNRVTHVKDFSANTLPQERSVPFQLGVEMEVDENGNVIYYYDMDDYKNMEREDFKRNFPKIYEQSKYQLFHPQGKQKGGASNIHGSSCAGTYKVSGYVRSDGIKVSSYERTCGAKHLGAQSASDKYRGLRIEQMTHSEINELLEELI